ncbi:hypothetical protein NM688_g2543 [Phlebia brevispora]|uniref:Uncharacterized protein n=1 Tax=Phlebia brevispora TaxID=194682 RepID=A0ACC1T871_9APHY|nr:hypothetical protein NM688_g2543 [Phlebia brevispora]
MKMGERVIPPSLLYLFPFPSFESLKSETDSGTRAFPYDQPPATQLKLGDYLFHGGIIAEICLGMVYGAPLAGILSADWESTFTVLGYLGLIGIVFEGGLSTNLPLLLSNLTLSTLCAATGVALPVAFSFALLGGGYGYTQLEAFAAGAALSSTSLGTTLMALNSVSQPLSRLTSSTNGEHRYRRIVDAYMLTEAALVGEEQKTEASQTPVKQIEDRPPLQHTRIGTVLISAAVIDDVIGLVLSSIIPALSAVRDKDTSARKSVSITWTIIRPLLSSFLMAAITPIVARYVLKPLFWRRGFGERWCAPKRVGKPWGWNSRWLFRAGPRVSSGNDNWGTEKDADAVKLAIMILVVCAFSSIAYYTGSSILFGAYLAGLTLTYISRPREDTVPPAGSIDSVQCDPSVRENALSFEIAYSRTIGPLQDHVFAPLFFASVGYAIPFISLWKPIVIWRGILYALLMAIAKMAVCLPVILWTILPKADWNSLRRFLRIRNNSRGTDTGHSTATTSTGQEGGSPNDDPVAPIRTTTNSLRVAVAPAAFMGIAMIARGEIGLLIAQIARGSPDLESGESDGLLGAEAFLVCMWAILLCTLVGPIGVGFVVRRWEGSIRGGAWG